MTSSSLPHANPELQQPGLQVSIDRLLALVDQEAQLVPRKNIFLCGFDQGMAVALAAFLVDGTGDFSGVIGISGWAPFAGKITSEGDDADEARGLPLVNRARGLYHPVKFGHLLESRQRAPDTPPPSATMPDLGEWGMNGLTTRPRILICHSFDDDVVAVKYGEQAWRLLEKMGLRVLYKENMAGATEPKHWFALPRCPNDISMFIRKNLQSCPHYFWSKSILMDRDGRVIPRPAQVHVGRSVEDAEPEKNEETGGEDALCKDEEGDGGDAPDELPYDERKLVTSDQDLDLDWL